MKTVTGGVNVRRPVNMIFMFNIFPTVAEMLFLYFEWQVVSHYQAFLREGQE